MSERRSDYGMQIEILVSLLYSFFVESGDAVVDGGASGGLHTIPLSRLVAPGGKVYAFEASPPVADWLKTWLGNSPAGSCIDLQPFALGDAAGEVEFIIEDDAGYSHVRRSGEPAADPARGQKSVRVKMVTLDEVLPTAVPVKFVKLDLEGMDFATLRGSQNLILRHRPLIVFENAAPISGTDYFRFFDDVEYEVYDLDNTRVTPENWGNGVLSFEAICGPRGARLDRARVLIDGFWACQQNRPVLESWDRVRGACADVFRYLLG